MFVMSQLNGDSVAMVAEVLVMGRSDVGWLCEVEGNQDFWATSQIAPGFQMPELGEGGAIQIADSAAIDRPTLALISFRATTPTGGKP